MSKLALPKQIERQQLQKGLQPEEPSTHRSGDRSRPGRRLRTPRSRPPMNTTQRTTLTPYIDSDVARKAAKTWAKQHGFSGNQGGWIYDPKGRPVAQGWFNFEEKYYASIRDWVTAQITAFDSFAQLVATDARYCPTLIARSWRERYLADSFDLWCYQAGQSRRDWRGGSR